MRGIEYYRKYTYFISIVFILRISQSITRVESRRMIMIKGQVMFVHSFAIHVAGI